MAICHCVGYLTNPGGVCCKDLKSAGYTVGKVTVVPQAPPSEDRIRKIIREEIERAGRKR